MHHRIGRLKKAVTPLADIFWVEDQIRLPIMDSELIMSISDQIHTDMDGFRLGTVFMGSIVRWVGDHIHDIQFVAEKGHYCTISLGGNWKRQIGHWKYFFLITILVIQICPHLGHWVGSLVSVILTTLYIISINISI